jgi:hypothetical protein
MRFTLQYNSVILDVHRESIVVSLLPEQSIIDIDADMVDGRAIISVNARYRIIMAGQVAVAAAEVVGVLLR